MEQQQFAVDTTFELDAQRTARVTDGMGLELIVHEGEVWVTQDGDSRDIILFANQSFTLDRNGLTLIHAFESSRLRLRPARRTARAIALPWTQWLQWARIPFLRMSSPQRS